MPCAYGFVNAGSLDQLCIGSPSESAFSRYIIPMPLLVRGLGAGVARGRGVGCNRGSGRGVGVAAALAVAVRVALGLSVSSSATVAGTIFRRELFLDLGNSHMRPCRRSANQISARPVGAA